MTPSSILSDNRHSSGQVSICCQQKDPCSQQRPESAREIGRRKRKTKNKKNGYTRISSCISLVGHRANHDRQTDQESKQASSLFVLSCFVCLGVVDGGSWMYLLYSLLNGTPVVQRVPVWPATSSQPETAHNRPDMRV